jgi:hypothetical protein
MIDENKLKSSAISSQPFYRRRCVRTCSLMLRFNPVIRNDSIVFAQFPELKSILQICFLAPELQFDCESMQVLKRDRSRV